MLSSSLVSLSTPAFADADTDRYAASMFNYCDAKLIGALWNVSPDEGKAKIGALIAVGGDREVKARLNDSRNARNKCDFEDTDFTTADADRLAQIWNLSFFESKLKVADLVTYGRGDEVKALLR